MKKSDTIDPVRSFRKPIRCKIVETGAIFKSMNECARSLGTYPYHVHYAINHGSPIGNYHIVKV